MPGRGTTDAIFIVRQIQEKFLAQKKDLWIAFVDLEKAFKRVPEALLKVQPPSLLHTPVCHPLCPVYVDVMPHELK
jgi:hypothetical protein